MSIEDDIARIALQEQRLRFPKFDAGVAWELGLALKDAADKREVGVAIDISTSTYSLFSHAMDGATPDNAEWVRRKRNVSLRFFRSSYAIGLELKRDGRTTRGEARADRRRLHGAWRVFSGAACRIEPLHRRDNRVGPAAARGPRSADDGRWRSISACRWRRSR